MLVVEQDHQKLNITIFRFYSKKMDPILSVKSYMWGVISFTSHWIKTDPL